MKIKITKWIGGRLRSLGFKKAHRDSKGVVYEITKAKIEEIKSRHTVQDEPAVPEGHTPEPASIQPAENEGEVRN